MFTVHGLWQGRQCAVTWDAGTLTGDPVLIAVIQTEATVGANMAVGPVMGPFTRNRHLQTALSALSLITAVFDTVLRVTGERPEAPDVPEDAMV